MGINILAFQCQECNYAWPLVQELPMAIDAFLQQLGGNLICPQCGDVSRQGKHIAMLLGDRYKQALADFQARGLIPQNSAPSGMV